jgi:hypothetical protein
LLAPYTAMSSAAPMPATEPASPDAAAPAPRKTLGVKRVARDTSAND